MESRNRLTGIVYDERMLDHKTRKDYVGVHPERPERIKAIHDVLKNSPEKTIHYAIDELDMDCLSIVEETHDPEYVRQIMLLSSNYNRLTYSARNDIELDAMQKKYDSIYLHQQSGISAFISCMGAITLAKRILHNEIQNGFAIIRPPGHHAETNCVSIFEAINSGNVILLANGVDRVLIVDWDIHHGNGTQSIFFNDPNVLYFSIHRYNNGEFYPGRKDASPGIVGGASALGKTVNVGWSSSGATDADYLYVFNNILMPIAQEFNPNFVIVSAGFDSAKGDPIGQTLVTPEGYGQMTYMLSSLANGKVLLLLEGGYSLDAIKSSAVSCFKVLTGDRPQPISDYNLRKQAVFDAESTIMSHSRYWKCLKPKYENLNVSHKQCKRLKECISNSRCSILTGKKMFPLSVATEYDEIFPQATFSTANLLTNNSILIVNVHEIPFVKANEPLLNSHINDLTATVNDFALIDISIGHRQNNAGQPGVESYVAWELEKMESYLIKVIAAFVDKTVAPSIIFIGTGKPFKALLRILSNIKTESSTFKRTKALIGFVTEVPAISPQPKIQDWFQRVKQEMF
ncbi:Arginase/deacetylase [Rozella allomycis CSF55]|uniref:histone deacetylase n=1 Tax=Rozella allomycis (strain CSF55) TaxID=988480 RepID=A0A4P9YQQ3_ROZAC|nr:Arginase/deacetylase [Rozella allomycis CSF55]